MSLGYDDSDPRSIEGFGKRLLGQTLRPFVTGKEGSDDFKRQKGSFGNLLEEFYFGYEPNSRPEPDFPKAGVELKSTPLKRLSSGQYRSKERLVLSMIDYMSIIDETWQNSSFLRKNSHLLLVCYEHVPGLSLLDFPIRLVGLWKFPDWDLEVIREDWNRVVDKIRTGHAHDLSEGDTLYLGAIPKGKNKADLRKQPNSPVAAMRRAFALKQGYLNVVLSRDFGMGRLDTKPIMTGPARVSSLESEITGLFEPYLGMTIEQIHDRVGSGVNRGAKGYYAAITKKILGVGDSHAEEFEKAEIATKTIRLQPNGTPKESMSFPYFKYKDLVDEEWDSSALRGYLTKRYFFVIYQYGNDNALRLKKVMFWTMPMRDVDDTMFKLWEETRRRIASGRAHDLPKISDNPIGHVRPKAQDANDTDEAPDGRRLIKKGFWLNARYVRDQIDAASRE